MSEPIRAICPHCERAVGVRIDGTIRHHVDKRAPQRNNFPWRPACAGIGWPAMEPEQVAAERSV